MIVESGRIFKVCLPLQGLMIEGNLNEYRQDNHENKSVNPIAAAAGAACFILVLPAAVIALMEFMDQIEYDSEFKWIIYSMVFSLTIISILLISGLYLVGLIKSDNTKMGAGIYLIALSGLNLLIRFRNLIDSYSYEKEWRVEYLGESFSWFDYIQLPWVHEQLELSFLGMLIGIIIMKR